MSKKPASPAFLRVEEEQGYVETKARSPSQNLSPQEGSDRPRPSLKFPLSFLKSSPILHISQLGDATVVKVGIFCGGFSVSKGAEM